MVTMATERQLLLGSYHTGKPMTYVHNVHKNHKYHNPAHALVLLCIIDCMLHTCYLLGNNALENYIDLRVNLGAIYI